MELIFVYNAKSDNVNMLIDYAHKIISPSTYSCNLCKLTHTNFGERKEWKEFIRHSSVKLEFYHIDEFEEIFNESFKYPIILKKVSDGFEILLNSKMITKLRNVNDLINVIREHTEFNKN